MMQKVGDIFATESKTIKKGIECDSWISGTRYEHSTQNPVLY